jgi:hypothetical protein
LTDGLDRSPGAVRKFARLMAVACSALGAFASWRGSPAWDWFLAAGIVFLVGGEFYPRMLRPVYVGWMKFAFILGWVNTRLVLGIFFYVILTPGSLVMRFLRRDVLRRKFEPGAPSYWISRPAQPFDPKRYERLF